MHDSQKFEDVLDLCNTATECGRTAPTAAVRLRKTAERGLKSRIHRRAERNRNAVEAQKAANTTRSRVRARVEHVFGHQQNAMGGKIVRTIGIARARFKIGMMNLGYEHPPAGSARAAGGCASLSTLTGGVRVASCNGARGRPPASKRPRSGAHLARALHSFAQLRQKSPNQLLFECLFAFQKLENWSHRVRKPLVWLGRADPCETVAKVREDDLKRAALLAVLIQWRKAIGVSVARAAGS